MFYPTTPFNEQHNEIVSYICENNSNIQINYVNKLFEWLCKSPKYTSIRVNLLKKSPINMNSISSDPRGCPANNTTTSSAIIESVTNIINSQLLLKSKTYENCYNIFTDNHNKIKIHSNLDMIPELIIIENDNINDLDEITKSSKNEHNNNNKEIIVDCVCGAALLRGAPLYAPGVLGMQSGIKANEIVNVYVDLEGQCKRGFNMRYVSDKNKVFIGIGCVKMQRYQLFNTITKNGNDAANADDDADAVHILINSNNLHGIAVDMIKSRFGIPSLDYSKMSDAGIGILQNIPSIICGRVVKPQPNEFILDMCAAPGNKTTHLGELIKNNNNNNTKGIIIALDKVKNKLDNLKNRIKLHELNNLVYCFTFDSIKAYCKNLPPTLALLSDTDDDDDNNFLELRELIKMGPPYPKNVFHKILLDAPCSASGNRPQLNNKITVKMLKSYPMLQKKLMKTAIALLRLNGILVYSTCSIFEQENENIVQWTLDNFPEMQLIDAGTTIDSESAAGHSQLQQSSEKLLLTGRGGAGWPNAGLTDEQRQMVQRFGLQLNDSDQSTMNTTGTTSLNHQQLDDHHRRYEDDDDDRQSGKNNINVNDTIGFFIAKFKKIT